MLARTRARRARFIAVFMSPSPRARLQQPRATADAGASSDQSTAATAASIGAAAPSERWLRGSRPRGLQREMHPTPGAASPVHPPAFELRRPVLADGFAARIRWRRRV